ncbi:hypothetical protein [Streptomyces ossamyceticus]|uniref:hypothetical protein n=1 Tax=Streptomyces ossamyceticus TaxID=249581 RepID=UPI0006E1240D|nr:hypothetical protein [Streptomyces ossamyceticus]
MSDYITALTGAGTTVAVGAVMMARSWPTPGQRRGPRRVAELLAEAELVPLDELLSAEREFATEYGNTAPAWQHCPGHDTPADSGWWCPNCHLPVHATTTTTGD